MRGYGTIGNINVESNKDEQGNGFIWLSRADDIDYSPHSLNLTQVKSLISVLSVWASDEEASLRRRMLPYTEVIQIGSPVTFVICTDYNGEKYPISLKAWERVVTHIRANELILAIKEFRACSGKDCGLKSAKDIVEFYKNNCM